MTTDATPGALGSNDRLGGTPRRRATSACTGWTTTNGGSVRAWPPVWKKDSARGVRTRLFRWTPSEQYEAERRATRRAAPDLRGRDADGDN